jgi:group I intron endonuclease
MRQPLDYKNGKIYVIRNHINDKVYVGSTTQSLSKRWGEHKKSYKMMKERSRKIYQAIMEYGIDRFYIELVENYPCENIEQLRAREGFCIRQFDSFKNGYNCQIEGRTDKEYYEENKDKIKAYHQEYQKENKDKIKAYNQEYQKENKDKIKAYHQEYQKENKESIKEYNSCHYTTHKEKYSENHKQYYLKNKDAVSVKHREYYQKNIEKYNEIIVCECGVEITKGSLSRHTKSKQHQNYLSSKINSS